VTGRKARRVARQQNRLRRMRRQRPSRVRVVADAGEWRTIRTQYIRGPERRRTFRHLDRAAARVRDYINSFGVMDSVLDMIGSAAARVAQSYLGM